jgi:DNA invertase Pin-like site-specific DNA recombinase
VNPLFLLVLLANKKQGVTHMNNQNKLNQTNERVWKCALYLRLSRDDGDKAESDSISNQKALLHEYARSRPELQICSERVDDGFSGVDFQRPSFIAMMDDIKAGLIDCVIVKDLSRFGRNWIESGKYIEQIFPYIGVRFIAINDQYDSLTAKTSGDNISLPFKNLMNDAYARDISIKTKSQLEAKCRKGDFIGSFAVYGYAKDERNHNKLVVDEFAAGIVRDIFKWRIEGLSNQGIANRLNEMGVLSPYEYKRELGLRFSTSFKTGVRAEWSAVAVSRILKNEVYLGVLEQGKKTSKSYKIKERFDKSKDEWIRVEHTHEPIVPIDDFLLVAELLKHDVRVSPTQETIYQFSGLLKCGDCGQNMVRKLVPSGGKKYVYYVCSAHKQSKGCSPHNISDAVLEQAVLQSIYHHISNIIEVERILQFIETLPLKQLDVQKLDRQIMAKKQEILKYNIRKTKLYEDLQDGIIDHSEYTKYKSDFTRLHNEAEQALFRLNADISDILENRTDKHQWITYFKEYQNVESLSRTILVKLVDKILISEKNKIEILFKYKYNFDRAVSFIETVSGLAKNENSKAKEAV